MVEELHLSPRHREEIEALLHKHLPGVDVWAYGSRVNGRSHDGSDLDLVLRGPKLAEIDTSRIADFIEVLQDSTIPFLVEVRDWARLPESFHHEVEREHVVLVERAERDVADEWREASLDDLLSFANGKSSPRRSNSLPHPVYGSNGIIGFSNEANAEKNTIIVGRVGSYCGSLYYSDRGCWVTDNAIRANAIDGHEARFLFFLLQTLRLNDRRAGSGQPLLNQTILSSIPVTVPLLPEQRAIAHILGTLDDKIELNGRMNETLEAMARVLFKSWFVDFDPVRAKMEGRDTGLPQHLADLFPDRMVVDSELGEMPEGWRVHHLEDCFDLTMGQSPPGHTYNDDGDGLPFFQGRSDFGFRYPENRKYCIAPNRIAKPGDTLVSVRAPVGDINMAWEECCIGRGVAALRHKSATISFTYHSGRALQEQLREYEHTGTVFGAINRGQFGKLLIQEPPAEIVGAFELMANPWDKHVQQSTAQTRTLTALRDTLLPKLISGEIRARQAEIKQLVGRT